MTVRVPLDSLTAGERELVAQAAHYLTRVHRLGRGDRFVAFDPVARTEADGEILEVGRRVRVRLGVPRRAKMVAERSVTVLMAAVSASKLDQVVRDATELGATRLVVVTTERSTGRGGRAERLWRIAVEAARQAGRGDMLEVSGPVPLADALRSAEGARVCLHPGANERFADALEGCDAVTVAIGPEGGFADDELELARSAGFRIVRLGRFTMRTETVCAAALGALAALTE